MWSDTAEEVVLWQLASENRSAGGNSWQDQARLAAVVAAAAAAAAAAVAVVLVQQQIDQRICSRNNLHYR